MIPTIPTARFLLLGAVGVVLFAGAGCSSIQAPALLPPSQSGDEGYGWRPDPAVNERAAAIYSGDDAARQEAAYNQAYAEFYHSTPDNAVADWQIAKRMDQLLAASGGGTDPKKKKAAYRQAYYETWHRLPPPNHPVPDTHLWIDPTSPQERERQEIGLDQPSRSGKIGTK